MALRTLALSVVWLSLTACGLDTVVDLTPGARDGGIDASSREDGGVDACTPRSCGEDGVQCGIASDGCGGTLDCGIACPDMMTCRENRCQPGICTPEPCSVECGLADNGCGMEVNCGDCAGGRRCDEGVCCPTCDDLGAACGTVDSACGPLTCGDCDTGVCDDENQCACLECPPAGDGCWIRDNLCGSAEDCGTCSGDLGCDNAGSCVACEEEASSNATFELALAAPAVGIGESDAFSSTLHNAADADLIRVNVSGATAATLEVTLTGFSPASDYELVVHPLCLADGRGFDCVSGVRGSAPISVGGVLRNFVACSSTLPVGEDEFVSAQIRCADGDSALFIIRVYSAEWDSCGYELKYSLRGA